MTLKSKRQKEIDTLKEQRRDDIVQAALTIFKSQSMANVKMTDIAEQAEVGVATVYRYFKTKFQVAKAAAALLFEQEISPLYAPFRSDLDTTKTGYEKVKMILDVTLNIYENHPEYIIFLEHFDTFILSEKIPKSELTEYDQSLLEIKALFSQALDQGKQDGSIRPDLNNDVFYMTITHALLALSQKLILRGHLIDSDEAVSAIEQLQMLITITLTYIKTGGHHDH